MPVLFCKFENCHCIQDKILPLQIQYVINNKWKLKKKTNVLVYGHNWVRNLEVTAEKKNKWSLESIFYFYQSGHRRCDLIYLFVLFIPPLV